MSTMGRVKDLYIEIEEKKQMVRDTIEDLMIVYGVEKITEDILKLQEELLNE